MSTSKEGTCNLSSLLGIQFSLTLITRAASIHWQLLLWWKRFFLWDLAHQEYVKVWGCLLCLLGYCSFFSMVWSPVLWLSISKSSSVLSPEAGSVFPSSAVCKGSLSSGTNSSASWAMRWSSVCGKTMLQRLVQSVCVHSISLRWVYLDAKQPYLSLS